MTEGNETETSMTEGKTVLEVLTQARALIADGWTQGAYARNIFGAPVDPCGDGTACFCSLGALYAASAGDIRGLFAAETILVRQVDTFAIGLAYWNDRLDRTHAEVLSAFDAAILKAKERETIDAAIELMDARAMSMASSQSEQAGTA